MSGQPPVFESGWKPAKASAPAEERIGVGFDVNTFVDNFDVLAGAAESVAELRHLVLTLAFQGRLSRRAETDGHASDALKAVVDDRSWRIEERPNKAKSDPKIEALVGVTHVPALWTECRLNDIAQLINGRAYAQPELLRAGTPVIRIQNLNGGNDWYYSDLKLPDRQYCDTGDLLFAWSASFGPYIWSGTKAIFHYHIWKLNLSSAVDKRFLFLALSHITDVVREQSHGLAMLHMTKGQMERWPILLPPLAEQKRIVAKVNQLMVLCDDLEARLTTKREIGTRLTKSALDAVTTAESPAEFDAAWKRVVDNFDVLLGCSGAVSELARTIRALAYSGALLGRRNSWPVSTIEGVSTKIVDCPHTTPEWTTSGLVCLRTTNFRVRGLDLEEVRYVSEATYDQRTARLKPQAGDIVYSREGGILGIACVIPEGELMCLGQRMMLIRPDPVKCLPEFVTMMLNAPQTVSRVAALTGGTASPHLNVGDVKRFVVPVPTLGEQAATLARAQQMLRTCDDLEARLRHAEDRAAKLAEVVVRELVA